MFFSMFVFSSMFICTRDTKRKARGQATILCPSKSSGPSARKKDAHLGPFQVERVVWKPKADRGPHLDDSDYSFVDVFVFFLCFCMFLLMLFGWKDMEKQETARFSQLFCGCKNQREGPIGCVLSFTSVRPMFEAHEIRCTPKTRIFGILASLSGKWFQILHCILGKHNIKTIFILEPRTYQKHETRKSHVLYIPQFRWVLHSQGAVPNPALWCLRDEIVAKTGRRWKWNEPLTTTSYNHLQAATNTQHLKSRALSDVRTVLLMRKAPAFVCVNEEGVSQQTVGTTWIATLFLARVWIRVLFYSLYTIASTIRLLFHG